MGIASAMHALGQAEIRTAPDFLERIKYLCEAVESHEFEAIIEATKVLSGKRKPDLQMWASNLALSIYEDPERFGWNSKTKPTKSDILAIMERGVPEFYDVIPKSKRGLSDWWKKVDCAAIQARGYMPKETKRMIDG